MNKGDPLQEWVDFLVKYGGHYVLVGLPSLLAIYALRSRNRYLTKTRGKPPHRYGRTGLIYWPSQLFLFVAWCAILSLSYSLGTGPYIATADGLLMSTPLVLTALWCALILNRNEHKYETRSSDTLFIYYLVTLFGSGLALFILFSEHDRYPILQMDPPPIFEYKMDPFRYLLVFTGAIGLAFFFEALPRGWTRVQRESKAQEGLTAYDQANWFSRLTFHFLQPLMSLGAKRTITVEDLDEKTPEGMKARVNCERISSIWDKKAARYYKQVNKKKAKGSKRMPAQPSLLLTVLSVNTWRITKMMVVRMLSFALLFVAPFLFSYLLKFFTDYDDAIKRGKKPPATANGLLIAVGIFVGTMASAIMLTASSNECSDMAIEARSGLIAMIYRKSLRLSPAARSKSTLGEISNYMAVDTESWMAAGNLLPLVLTIPVEIGLGIWLLYRLLGWSLLAGLAVFAIISPIQTLFASFLHSYQKNKLKAMDNRLRLMTEILANIKIVKLYSWEDAFRKKIGILRDRELDAQRALSRVRAFLLMVFSSVNLLMILATFAVYSNFGGPDFTPAEMTPQIVFVGIALFSMMSRPLGIIPLAISHVILLRTSNRRIASFLLLEEIDPTVVERHGRQTAQQKDADGNGINTQLPAVEIENGTFAWDKDSITVPAAPTTSLSPAEAERQPLLGDRSLSPSGSVSRPTLTNIKLSIFEGNLTAIVGRIGQGKSSLLSAILGEMYKLEGTVRTYGSIAYVPQQAWIINATVRENVLLGKPFDQEKYDRIIYASGLKPDIDMLPAEDLTEIGERGINLSGGQKQRVSLARAAYQDADIYLLDDPLSAVDAHVDQHLWHNLIGPNGLLKDKTRILITHGIHHLSEVDQIVVMKDGTISEAGEYQQLMKAQDAFYQLIYDFSVKRQLDNSHSKDDNTVTQVGSETNKTVGDDDSKAEATTKSASAGKTIAKTGSGGLVGKENVEEGKVGWRVYWDYARAVAFICLCLYGVAQACQISTNFWLRYWITSDEREGEEDRPAYFYLVGYASLVLLFLVVDVTVNYMANVVCGIRSARILYNGLLTRVLRYPMSTFDTTPMGRIVNRFSSDVAAIDSNLPEQLPGLLGFASSVVGIICVIGYSTPLFLYAVPPLLLTFLVIQNYYIKTSGAIKRLVSVTKSPLYQHFGESLAGVSTIRSLDGLQSQFITENESRTDAIARKTNTFMLTNRWLTIRIQAISASVILSAAVLAVLNVERLDPSLVGLAMTYALSLTNVVVILVRTASDVQNQFVSVERIREYSEKPVEAPLEVAHSELPENWPEHGRITFNKYSARYRQGLDLSLKDVTFTVDPQEKVGIVGRTGAGKSSLTLALFRIIEAADSFWALASDPSRPELPMGDCLDNFGCAAGGSIEIDGVDIASIGLRQLRKHLSIIPQDPTLFAGTVRENLDPFFELEDSALWEALERAHLKDFIGSLPGGLSFEVSANGDNFSMGQRSLICLARALLRKTKVLVLDEATAAVDIETDELIQKTIRAEFKDRTIMTIAHRIKTVMDSDKVLVLENGRVQEFEEPKSLLTRRESLFYRLAEQAGELDIRRR
ncbi:P-loop containing nucleoside triphosphate hydrolase protein [Linnemannia elongata AG-77]|uniref:p-loop containing nucleoside triphosphate hydrolase protein n=1 Tax=Linnemannia elongata AG-77 TaxID=1314771 RepID=A0A197KA50_9FUNG|nr:P-loop containing nucleoside triphosphate hydrolase protein [Linnemannia elongata AG-77]